MSKTTKFLSTFCTNFSTPLKNMWQNSSPNINHHFAIIKSAKRLTIQFSPQFCTDTLLGPNFLLSALFSNTLNLSHLRFSPWRMDPVTGHGLPLRDFTITLIGHTTVGRTPPDEWSARRKDLYLRTHNTHTLTRGKHLCPRSDSHPQYQQASDRRRTH